MGVQSLLNVVTGKRYSVKSKELKDYDKAGWVRKVAVHPLLRNDRSGGRCGRSRTGHGGSSRTHAGEGTPGGSITVFAKKKDVLTYIAYPEAFRGFFYAKRAPP